MFFILSKTLGLLLVPLNFISLLICSGAFLVWTRFFRAGRYLLSFGAVLFVLSGILPAGNALIAPLEHQFPRPTDIADAPDGIIVLGGAIDPKLSNRYGTAKIEGAANRIVAAVDLARRFPRARIIYSGGNASLTSTAPGEASFARQLFIRLGITPERIEIEDRSRNTAQNAEFSKALAQPRPGQRWLLVTSAYHMPRAVGCFRRVGFDVIPYPVDQRARGWKESTFPFAFILDNFSITDHAVREWFGLAIYWITGRTSQLFPGVQ